MRDDFLFDDDDPKQRGQGCDAIMSQSARLNYNWKWRASYLKRNADWNDHKPGGITGQTSFVDIGGFTLNAIF